MENNCKSDNYNQIFALKERNASKMTIQEIKEKALEDHIPIIMDDTLQKINEILNEYKPKKLLEIGTAVGYSAICFEKYVSEEIDTIEQDEERFVEAKRNIESLELTNKINLIKGNAIEILQNMQINSEEDKYDFVFIDAAKSKYPIFLQEALRLTKNNAVIVADNVLYKGYVLSDYNKHKQRTAVRHLREFLKMISENENLESEILEIVDGLAIIKKK